MIPKEQCTSRRRQVEKLERYDLLGFVPGGGLEDAPEGGGTPAGGLSRRPPPLVKTFRDTAAIRGVQAHTSHAVLVDDCGEMDAVYDLLA